MNLAMIITAAGASRRFAEDAAVPGRSKLDEDLGGRPVLQRTVELFTGLPEVTTIVVAGPHDPEAMRAFRERHADKLALLGARLVTGGAQHRYETVAAALAHVPNACTHIGVHDAARPCTSPELIQRVIDAASRVPAVIPGIDVPDTLKRVAAAPLAPPAADPLDAILADAPASRRPLRAVETTLDRTRVIAVQTPQLFEAALLRRAYAQDDLRSTDDAQLVERLGVAVAVVEGDPRNIKITRGPDIGLARAILGVRAPEGRPAHKRF